MQVYLCEIHMSEDEPTEITERKDALRRAACISNLNGGRVNFCCVNPDDNYILDIAGMEAFPKVCKRMRERTLLHLARHKDPASAFWHETLCWDLFNYILSFLPLVPSDEEIREMLPQKILIVGAINSGKSCLAQYIGDNYNYKVYDQINDRLWPCPNCNRHDFHYSKSCDKSRISPLLHPARKVTTFRNLKGVLLREYDRVIITSVEPNVLGVPLYIYDPCIFEKSLHRNQPHCTCPDRPNRFDDPCLRCHVKMFIENCVNDPTSCGKALWPHSIPLSLQQNPPKKLRKVE